MEVAFSQQLFLLSLKKNIILFNYFFWSISCYRKTEVGAQNLKLQFAVPYHVVYSLSHVQERTLEDGRRSNSYRSAHNELLYSFWGVIFIWFFPLTIFPHWGFFRGVFSHGCAGHMPKINYFSVGSPQLVHLLYPLMLDARIWCMLSVLRVHYL